MKKTLVALAALASVSAYAQTSVVIDGYMDRGFLTTNSSNDTADTKAWSSNAGTTTFGIKVREDLGAGLSAGISINTDWSELGGLTQAVQTANTQTSGFANSASFLDITSTDFGTVRLGAPNNFTLTNSTAIATPAFSTGVGSMYSSAYGWASGLGTGLSGRGGSVDTSVYGLGTAAITAGLATHTTARAIRNNNTIQYSSPTFNGVSLHIGLVQANNNVTVSGTVGNTAGVNETALRYTNGPIDAMYSTIKYTIGSNGITQSQVVVSAAGATTWAADTNAAQTSTHNLLGIAYQVLPNLKLNMGSGTFSHSLGLAAGTMKSFGGTYTTGQFDLMLLTSNTNDTTTTNVDRKMTGYGVNYNLSKQTRAYFRMDNLNYGSNIAAVSGSTVKRTGFGISKSF